MCNYPHGGGCGMVPSRTERRGCLVAESLLGLIVERCFDIMESSKLPPMSASQEAQRNKNIIIWFGSLVKILIFASLPDGLVTWLCVCHCSPTPDSIPRSSGDLKRHSGLPSTFYPLWLDSNRLCLPPCMCSARRPVYTTSSPLLSSV